VLQKRVTGFTNRIGLPTLVANHAEGYRSVECKAKRLAGNRPVSTEDQVDPAINAGKQTATTLPGSSIFSADSSLLIRGGRLTLPFWGDKAKG
jgi:3-oxoacid CoA-transferase subunit B